MARKVELDPGKVEIAWVPEENAYRTVERRVETGEVAGVEVSVEVADHGDQVVWVDDAPDDQEDGSGHFEKYDSQRHGETYAAIYREPQEDE